MADAERVRLVQDAFWRNEKLRRRLQLAEDMARRDPVWAEKMARRHAEFNAKRSALAAVTTTAPTPEVTTTGASVPDWRDQRARRRAELEEKAARRQAEFTALSPAIAAQAAAEVSAAITAAFRDARAEHHEDLAAKVPTTCSSECSSKNAPASVSVTISSTASNSSTTICGVVPELAAPTVSDKAIDMDIPGDTAPTASIYLLGGPNPTTVGEDTVSVSMTPWSAPPSCNAPLDELPSPWSAPMGVLELFMLSPSTCSTDCSCHRLELPPKLLTKTYDQFNVVSTGNGIAPWPPPSCTSAGAALIHGQDLFQHAQQNRGNKFSVKGRKGDWYAIFLEVELKPPWPSLGVCTNLPMGHLLSSLGSITVNDNSSHYANWCLYDVFWKLSRWWSHTECVRPANAILDVSSWLWITSKHGKVHFQSSSPLFPVNCHTMAYFPRSRRAQMNVESNCGISLKLFVYCRYPVLNSAHTCPWIAGLLPPCGRESDVVFMLIYQLPVPYLQLFPGLLGAVQGYIISSSSAFLAMINGGLEVQQHYTCMMVLSVAVCKGWIHYHILQNNTHYPEMMQWSFSQSQLQSAFQFSTPGHILSISCALVQWKNPWSIRLVSLKFWFPCCHVERKYRENFQWTIAWLFSCQRLEMTELTPWRSWELFPCIYAVTSCLLGAFHILTSSVVTLQGIYSKCSHYFEVHILDQICIMFSTSIILHAGKLYRLWGLYSSCDRFLTEGAICFGSQLLEWKIPWYIAWLLVKPSCAHMNFGGTGGLIMHVPVKTLGLHPTKNATNILGADIYGQNWQNSTKLQNPSRWNGWSFLNEPILFLGMLLLARPVELNGFGELKKYWDPGGVELRPSETGFVIWPGESLEVACNLSSQDWVVLSSAGDVGCATSYGAKYFEWQIAWPPNLRTLHLKSWSSCAKFEGMPHFIVVTNFPYLMEQFYTAGLSKRLARGRAKIYGGRNVSVQSYYLLRSSENPYECSVDQYIHRQLFFGATTPRYNIVHGSSLETSIFTILVSVLLPWDPGDCAGSLGDMQDNSLPMQFLNHELRAANGQAGVHVQHWCLPWDPGDSSGTGLRASRILRRRECQRPFYYTAVLDGGLALLGLGLLRRYEM